MKVDVECGEEYYEIPEFPQNEMNYQHLENFQPDLYEEFSNQDDEKISNINFNYLKIIDDNENSTKIDKKSSVCR